MLIGESKSRHVRTHHFGGKQLIQSTSAPSGTAAKMNGNKPSLRFALKRKRLKAKSKTAIAARITALRKLPSIARLKPSAPVSRSLTLLWEDAIERRFYRLSRRRIIMCRVGNEPLFLLCRVRYRFSSQDLP